MKIKNKTFFGIFSMLISTLFVLSSITAAANDFNQLDELFNRKLTLNTGEGPFNVAISPDNSLFVTTNYLDSENKLSFYKIDKNFTILNSGTVSGMPGMLYDLKFSPDGKILVVTNRTKNTIDIFNVEEDGSLVFKNSQSVGINPFDVTFSPDGSKLAVSSENDNKISIFEIDKDKNIFLTTELQMDQGSAPRGVDFSPDGKLLAVANLNSNDFFIYMISDDNSFVEIHHETNVVSPRDIIFSPNGNLLAVVNMSKPGYITLFNISLNENQDKLSIWNKGKFHVNDLPYRVRFSPDQNILIVSNGEGNTISMFILNGSKIFSSTSFLNTGVIPYGINFSNDGVLFAQTNYKDNNFTIFKTDYTSVNDFIRSLTEVSDNANVSVNLSSSLSLALEDGQIELTGSPNFNEIKEKDNLMFLKIKTNNILGYTLNVSPDSNFLSSNTNNNDDSIEFSKIFVNKVDNEIINNPLKFSEKVLLKNKETRTSHEGDLLKIEFFMNIPFVNADDYTGTITYTATAN